MDRKRVDMLEWHNVRDEQQHKTLIIHGGGAFSMKSDPVKGFKQTPDPDRCTRILEKIPLFYKGDVPTWCVIEVAEPKDSSCFAVRDWVEIAGLINDYSDSSDSVVVIMGTDTLSFCASALSFMLENINKPIILTGAMVPIQQTRSDAIMNIIGAMQMAMLSRIHEVCVFFSGSLLRGNRCTKIRCTTYQGAFESPNYPALGSVGVGLNINRAAEIRRGRGPFEYYPMKDEPKVVIMRLFPGMTTSWIYKMLACRPQGIIIETYGSGNAAGVVVPVLAEAIRDGVVIVNVTQCTKGTVVQEAYKVGNVLSEAGITSGRDMTVESAFTKLIFLLSQGYDASKVSYLMGLSIAGELKENK